MDEEANIAPGAFRNKMNSKVREFSRELEKLKRDLVQYALHFIMGIRLVKEVVRVLDIMTKFINIGCLCNMFM